MVNLCIILPTYNRADKLDSVLHRISILLPDHHLRIYDNCSTDRTGEVCSRFCDAHSNVAIIKRPVNIGANGNIMNAIIDAQGKGDMMWVISDDDIFDREGLQCLVEWLAARARHSIPDALVVGGCSGLDAVDDWPTSSISDSVAARHDFWYHASFLPAVIMKAHSVKRSIDPGLFYIGGCYSQLLYYRCLASPEAVIESVPLRVVYRGADAVVHGAPAWLIISWLRVGQLFPVNSRSKFVKAVVGSLWSLPLRYIKALSRGGVRYDQTFARCTYFDLLSSLSGGWRLYAILWLPLVLIPPRITWNIYSGFLRLRKLKPAEARSDDRL
jgi:glycosyltransferase involved in cell wall biosynthesis